MSDSNSQSIESLKLQLRRLREHCDRTEAILATHVTISSDAIVNLRDGQLIAEFNAQAEDLFGWKREQVIGEPIVDLIIHEQDRDVLLRQINRVSGRMPFAEKIALGPPQDSTHYSTTMSTTIIDRQGQLLPMQVTLIGNEDDSSGKCSMVFHATTIHDDVLTALLGPDSQTQSLLQFTTEGIYGVDQAGLCTFANKAATNLLGYQSSTLLVGKPIHDLIHQTQKDGTKWTIENCRIRQASEKGEGSFVDDEIFWKQDGTSIPVEYRSIPVRRDGQWVGSVVTFTDTTDRRQQKQKEMQVHRDLEHQVNASKNELANAKERFDLAVTRANVGLWDWNAKTDEVYYSPTYKSQLGFPEDVDCHDFEFWRSSLHPEDIEGALRRVDEYFQRKVTDYRSTFRMRCADGSYRWFLAQGNADFDADGKPKRMIGVHVDITDQVNSEREMARLNEALSTTNEALRESNFELQQFASVASHDLQAPLRAITGFAQFLLDDYGGKLDDNADDYLNRIVRNSKRMQRLIDDLLTFSRVESRSAPHEKVDLNESLEDALQLLKADLETADAIVTFDKLPTVDGDKALLTQLFQNLIANGIKYHDQGSPRVEISAESSQDDSGERPEQQWTIRVKDNGIGIDPKHQERIFEIFRRLHTQSTYTGSGIGLALCRRIATRHGGSIGVESQPGQGSTFYFSIPRAPVLPQDMT
ncbi:PAS domain-containing sensor histidine kinase [Planctomycetes bacterium K23_9]|uniref:histidine kinase n=1 Tax=Stieleria marina TaxID=1930275 RepID=A0A517NR00_9BACT|nr:Phytochrome-like protein cph1 [Planctomycetes bacterium K23_9]